MNDASKYPSNGLVLKLHWPPDTDAQSGTRYVVVELQDTAGLVVASMSVPRDQLLQAFTRQLDHHPSVTLDGFVSAADGFELANFEEISFSQLKNPPIALDKLVADAVSPEMLDDEPEASKLLSEFHARLLKSLEFVEKAIASLPEP
jgi:hypothetical protein